MSEKQQSRGIQSVEVGGRILNALVEAGRPLPLRDLAAMAEMPPTQAHAYLVSFKKLDLVDQDLASGRYELGPFALRLGLVRLDSFQPLRCASVAGAELAREMGAVSNVVIWSIYGPCVVEVHDGIDDLQANIRPGMTYGLTSTATGRAFAAFLPRDTIQPVLDKELARGGLGGAGDGFLRKWEESLKEVRRRGHAAAHGRPSPGLNALAFPIFDAAGLQVVTTLIGKEDTFRIEPDGPIAAEARRRLNEISRDLGGHAFMPADG